MKYTYFVAYAHPRGFGRSIWTQEEPVTSEAHIARIEQVLREQSHSSWIALLNFQLLTAE